MLRPTLQSSAPVPAHLQTQRRTDHPGNIKPDTSMSVLICHQIQYSSLCTETHTASLTENGIQNKQRQRETCFPEREQEWGRTRKPRQTCVSPGHIRAANFHYWQYTLYPVYLLSSHCPASLSKFHFSPYIPTISRLQLFLFL